jgi:CheY-like chemotaxis protein
MNSWRILVIDDEAMKDHETTGTRHAGYLQLKSIEEDRKPFSVDFACSIDDAHSKLSSTQYDLILLDVILKYWDDDETGTRFRDLFIKSSARCAVGLISSAWDVTSIPRVRGVLNENSEISIPLMFTLKDFQETGGRASIAFQIVNHVRRRRGAHGLDIGAGDPIRIVHLSDLHFGGEDVRTVFRKNSIETMSNCIKSYYRGEVHLLAITGDVSNRGHPSEYDMALDWLQSFADKLGIPLPSPRVLLVPGNHDFNIPLAAAASLQIAEKEQRPTQGSADKHDERLCHFAMHPFLEFARKVTPLYDACRQGPPSGWTSSAFSEYGVIFSGFNTAKACNSAFWPRRTIDEDELHRNNQALSPYSDKIRCGELLHIALSHHSPVNYQYADQPVEKESQDAFTEHYLGSACAPRLLLHGHQHERHGAPISKGKCFVVSSPSPSKMSVDTPRGINLLTLHRKQHIASHIEVKALIRDQKRWVTRDIEETSSYEFK